MKILILLSYVLGIFSIPQIHQVHQDRTEYPIDLLLEDLSIRNIPITSEDHRFFNITELPCEICPSTQQCVIREVKNCQEWQFPYNFIWKCTGIILSKKH